MSTTTLFAINLAITATFAFLMLWESLRPMKPNPIAVLRRASGTSVRRYLFKPESLLIVVAALALVWILGWA
jgi:hypothetical protein